MKSKPMQMHGTQGNKQQGKGLKIILVLRRWWGSIIGFGEISMSSQAPVFRYDINGLRAYAVLAVLLFHFNLFGLNAGFIGVDLFFVISGYLMTSIVVRGLEKNNFSFGNFYLSRLRRIVPALLVLISVFTIFAWFYLTTPALKKFSKEA